ncbi:unnamed protein product [Dibothriocephalus latus]|uniref:Ketoreductase (KR) domain-containing protein n=1 Tax=Dibothriocephalus latus TaxID=60516 RepID=A0A3P7QB81_DIBLA|nr:unnamed protein product [Dibothriocephalus latus]
MQYLNLQPYGSANLLVPMFTPVFAFLTVTIISYLVWRWFNRPHCVDIRNRHVLITGGSSGIGLALAREAAKRGAYVTIVARNKTRLSKAKEELSEFADDASKISTLSMDLCGPFEEIKKCLESNIGNSSVRQGPILRCHAISRLLVLKVSYYGISIQIASYSLVYYYGIVWSTLYPVTVSTRTAYVNSQ